MNRKYTKNEIENQNVNNMFADLEKLPDREKLEKDNYKRFKIFFLDFNNTSSYYLYSLSIYM